MDVSAYFFHMFINLAIFVYVMLYIVYEHDGICEYVISISYSVMTLNEI